MARVASKNEDSLSKTDFIKQFPDTTPVAEVIEKAKAAGIALTKQHVYNVHAYARKKAHRGTAAAKQTERKKAHRGATKPSATKALAQGRRRKKRVRAAAPISPRTSKRAESASVNNRTVSASVNAHEQLFMSAAIELGLARAEELLRTLRARYAKLA